VCLPDYNEAAKSSEWLQVAVKAPKDMAASGTHPTCSDLDTPDLPPLQARRVSLTRAIMLRNILTTS